MEQIKKDGILRELNSEILSRVHQSMNTLNTLTPCKDITGPAIMSKIGEVEVKLKEIGKLVDERYKLANLSNPQ